MVLGWVVVCCEVDLFNSGCVWGLYWCILRGFEVYLIIDICELRELVLVEISFIIVLRWLVIVVKECCIMVL